MFGEEWEGLSVYLVRHVERKSSFVICKLIQCVEWSLRVLTGIFNINNDGSSSAEALVEEASNTTTTTTTTTK